MNPKISIVVDAKNKAIASLTGMVTVGAKIEVEITGLPSGIESWAATDKFCGKSVRFRIVDELGHDLVRFPLVEKTSSASTDGDQWLVTAATSSAPEKYETHNGYNITTVDFDTAQLRREFRGIPFNEYREFGVILDSIVDSAQYAVGRIKIRQWASASTEDPTVLPDWRETLAELNTKLGQVEGYKNAASASASSAADSASSASASASSAAGSASTALTNANNASNSAIAANEYANGKYVDGTLTVNGAKQYCESAEDYSEIAEAQVEKYPRIDGTTKHWERYGVGGWVDTGVVAEGQDGAAATISVGSVTTGAAGSSASVVNSGTSSAAVFDFTIPRGANGSNGTDGSDGFSPVVTVTTITGGHSVAIEDATSTKTFNVMDGEDGATGPSGSATIKAAVSGISEAKASLTSLKTQFNLLLNALKGLS